MRLFLCIFYLITIKVDVNLVGVNYVYLAYS